MVSKLSREGSYRKGLEVFEALPAVGLVSTHELYHAEMELTRFKFCIPTLRASWTASRARLICDNMQA